jgi:hypothetical protein
MEIIDHKKNCKKILIEEILNTNNNLYFFTISDNKSLLSNFINEFKGYDFYKLLVLLNHNNYNGYFFQSQRLKLAKYIILNKNIKECLKIMLEEKVSNEEVLNIEIFAINLLLEKMILGKIKKNFLEELEEIKYNLYPITTEKLRNKFYNFKNKIHTESGEIIDVFNTLKSIISGNHNLMIKDLVYIKNYYQDELEIIKII